ncbi:MAG TPA: PAS domain S-box protein, partial [Rhizomicrobium sp.]
MSDGDAGHFITSDLVARAFEGARVVIRDVEGTILYWTEGASELYGFGKEESLGKSSHELLQTIFPEPLETINKILLSTGQWSGELQHRSRDGHALIVATHWSLQPYDGKYVVAEVNNDITKETALKRDQAYLATIVASSDDAIMSKSPDGVIQTWNGAAERMFGYTVEEIVGQKAAILFPPHLIDEEAEILARIYTGNSVEIYDTLRRRKDGSTFPVSVRISPIRSEKGEIVGSSKILRDITLQKE